MAVLPRRLAKRPIRNRTSSVRLAFGAYRPAVRRSVVTLGRATAYLTVFLAAAAVDAVVATTWIRPDLAPVVGTLMWAVPVLALYVADPWPDVNARAVWLMVAWFLSAFLMFTVVWAFWASVLLQRGERVNATVTEVHDKGNGGVTYTLAHDGVRIPGRLTSWPGNDDMFTDNAGGSVGDPVTVICDPEGLVDPRLPEELAEARESAPLITSLTIAVMAGLCVGAAWSRDREETPGWLGARKAAAARSRAREELTARAAARSAENMERIRQARQRNRPMS
jgi:hypothetical protein